MEDIRNNESIRFDRFPSRIVEILDLDEELKQESLEKTMQDLECRDHMNLINESIELIKIFGIDKKYADKAEIALKELTFRIYNGASAAFTLMMGGLQQVSLMPQRDILECSLLLKMFSLDRTALEKWKQGKEFRPKEVRDFIEKHDEELKEGFAANVGVIYKDLSKRGIHPNFYGIAAMLTKDTDPKTIYPGPFFDLGKLKKSLAILASILGVAVHSVIEALGKEPPELELIHRVENFIKQSSLWLKKYDPTKESKINEK